MLRTPPSNAGPSADTFRRDVEGLRAVAVLLVVACHCDLPWCRGGFIGVDVFFVLSGYLITGLLAAEHRATSRIDLPAFFARRARRLLPACALVTLATLLASIMILSPMELASSGRAALATALYVSNVFFDHGASNYFSPRVAGNPLLHTWSLGVEEQFYLLWPLLLMLLLRATHPRRRWVGALGLLAVGSLLVAVYATTYAPTFAFYELPARAWEFGAGGVLALLPDLARALSARSAVICGALGMLLVLAAAGLLQGGSGFPGWVALAPVTGTVAVLLAGTVAPRAGVSALLGLPVFQFIGSRSYAWYLWHWPFIVFSDILLPEAPAGKLAAAGAALLAADLSYRIVERPVRESAILQLRPRLSLAMASGIAAVLVAAASASMAIAVQQQRQDQSLQTIVAAQSDIGNLPERCWSENESFEVKVCEFGAATAAGTLVLFGDSHAMQWVNAMRTVTDRNGWRLVTLVRPGCAASDINPHRLSAEADHCKQWRRGAIEKIIALHPSAVVMTSYNGATLRGDFLASSLMPTEEIRTGTRWTLERLSQAGVPTILLRDTPLPPFNVPACLARRTLRRLHPGEACEFDATAALNPAAYDAERRAAQGLAGVFLLDMDDLICPGATCPATLQGRVVYRDENHLTGGFAEQLAPMVQQRLFMLLKLAGSA